MATNGASIERAVGIGVSFSQPTGQITFNLDAGIYQLLLTMTDAANPGEVQITDPNGNVLTFAAHGQFRYWAGAQPYGTYVANVIVGGIDLLALTQLAGGP